MREHSNIIRRSTDDVITIINEDPILESDDLFRYILVMVCRNKQRLLQQAWNKLVKVTGVKHDYTYDVRKILSRIIPADELRTEFEIEVIWKWASQNAHADPTGIANALTHSRRKTVAVAAMQHCRLEKFVPGDAILFQNNLPRMEDGHFTVFFGECEVLSFPPNSVQILRLQEFVSNKRWDEANRFLANAQTLGVLRAPSGFGELSTLTNTTRTATIRASRKSLTAAEVLIIPKQHFIDCLEAGREAGSTTNTNLSESIDFLRQSGLANRISSKDLVAAAGNMIKRTLLHGEVLYCKGETVSSLYLVLSGDFILDTGEGIEDKDFRPFHNTNSEKCYHLSGGSILGDEGLVGTMNTFESTAAVVSEFAVIFEVVGAGTKFLAERIGVARYCGLAYKDLPRLSPAISAAEQTNLYSFFHSLRKAIAFGNPNRGTVPRQKAFQLQTKSQSQLLVSSLVQNDKNNSKSISMIDNSNVSNVNNESNKYSNVNKSLLLGSFPVDSKGRNDKNDVSNIRTIKSNYAKKRLPSSSSLNKMSLSSNSITSTYNMRTKAKVVPSLINEDMNNISNVNIGDDNDSKAEGKGNGNGSGRVGSMKRINGLKYVRDFETDGTGEGSVRRMIYGVCLHHAEEASKVAKKVESNMTKVNAEASVIIEEINKVKNSGGSSKDSMTAGEFNAQREASRRVRTSIMKYRERLAADRAREEAEQLNAAASSVAVHFFASLSTSQYAQTGGAGTVASAPTTTAVPAGVTFDDTASQSQSQPRSQQSMPTLSREQSQMSIHSNDGASDDGNDVEIIIAAPVPKIDLYHAWLERSKQEAVLAAAAAAAALLQAEADAALNYFLTPSNNIPGIDLKTLSSSPTVTMSPMVTWQQQQKPAGSTVHASRPPSRGTAPTTRRSDSRGSTSRPRSRGKSSARKEIPFFRLETPNIRRTIPLNSDGSDLKIDVDKEVHEESADFLHMQRIESPSGFFAALDAMDFPVKRRYRPNNTWSTRFMVLKSFVRASTPASSVQDKVKTGRASLGTNQYSKLLDLDLRKMSEDDIFMNKIAGMINNSQSEDYDEDEEEEDGRESTRMPMSSKDKDKTSSDLLHGLGLEPVRRLSVIFDSSRESVVSECFSEDSASVGANANAGASIDVDIAATQHVSSDSKDKDKEDSNSIAKTHDMNPSLVPSPLLPLPPPAPVLAPAATPSSSSSAPPHNLFDYPHGSLATLNPPSAALAKFEELVNGDDKARKFLMGKKYANSKSRFQLHNAPTPFEGMNSEGVKVEAKALDSDALSSAERTLQTLANCLRSTNIGVDSSNSNPNSNGYRSYSKQARVFSTVSNVSSSMGTGSLKEYMNPEFRSVDAAAVKELDRRYDSILFESLKYSREQQGMNVLNRNSTVSSTVGNGNGMGDAELLDWQKYSVQEMIRRKESATMTLPVLIRSSFQADPLQMKYNRGRRARRWGNGRLVEIAGISEYDLIEGPSSYLEVYKHSSASSGVKLRTKHK